MRKEELLNFLKEGGLKEKCANFLASDVVDRLLDEDDAKILHGLFGDELMQNECVKRIFEKKTFSLEALMLLNSRGIGVYSQMSAYIKEDNFDIFIANGQFDLLVCNADDKMCCYLYDNGYCDEMSKSVKKSLAYVAGGDEAAAEWGNTLSLNQMVSAYDGCYQQKLSEGESLPDWLIKPCSFKTVFLFLLARTTFA